MNTTKYTIENIKLSILVCSYNQEKFIKQTLDSILSQEHDYSYELIVCDDASRDSTPKIISQYSEKKKEIIPILRNENLGIVNNFFDGISKSRGEYVMICGGDDYYAPGKIKVQIEYLENHPNIGLVHSDVLAISEEDKKKRIIYGHSFKSVEDMLTRYSVNATTMTFRKSDLEKYIRDVDPMNHNWKMEDVPLAIWFKANNKMHYLPGVVANYRILDQSISHHTTPEAMLEFEKSTLSVLKFFQTKFPEKISLKFVYLRHLTSLLNRPLVVVNHNEYCNNILNTIRELDSKHTYYLNELRIKNPLLNKAFRIQRLLKKGFIFLADTFVHNILIKKKS